MPILSKIAHSDSWSCVTVMLAVSAMVAGILFYLRHKKLASLRKDPIEQTGRAHVMRWPWLDFRLGKPPHSSLEDGQVDDASSAPESAANHQQLSDNTGAGDGRRDQFSTAFTPHSPGASKAESGTWLLSLVAEAESGSELQGMNTYVNDNPPRVLTSNLNEPANMHKPVSSMENRTDESESDMRQKHQAESDNGQRPLHHEKREGWYETSRLPSVDVPSLGGLGAADYHAEDALCGIGSKHQLLDNGDSRTQEVSQELYIDQNGEDHGEHERHIVPEIPDNSIAITLWHLAVARRAPPTEAMIDVISKLALAQEQ